MRPLAIVELSAHRNLYIIIIYADERLGPVSFTLRTEQTLIRIISARPMHRKERAVYAQTSEKDSEIQE
ncbi:MAG: BrnT family toxin [Anaerolineae bacterium]|nr:BrnT family toxin [Anaerolineae bacterium]